MKHIDTRQRKYCSTEFKKAQETANLRLYPSIFSAGYLELRRRRIRMGSFFTQMAQVDTILDVGAQYCPYFPLFKNKCKTYLSMDIVDTPIVDIVCNAESMPVNDSSVDVIICTQVLEHCNDPQKVIDECYRVLKRGGILIITVPSVFPEHGYPHDNWRFMPQGLRHVLRKFSSVTVFGEMDFFESWISANFYYFHSLAWKLGVVGKVMNPLVHITGNSMALILSQVSRLFTKNNFSSFSMTLWAEVHK